MSFFRHVQRLWGRWWLLPTIPLLYAIVVFSIGDLRPEHLVFAVLSCAFGFWSARSRSFFIDVSPYLAVGVLYDAVRYARRALLRPEQVWGCELRSLDVALFGPGSGQSMNDWFQAHAHPALDLFFAVPYAIFAYVALAYAAYLYFVDRRRMRHYLWAFALANVISFVMWLTVPAAPPWYIRAHGCGIDLSAVPSAAALTRVDALLGVDYFAAFYSRATSVFGAMPSMHCAYPVLGLLTAWRAATWWTRPLHLAYTAAMFLASMYLDHHWVVDGLAGWTVAAFSVFVAGRVLDRVSAPDKGATAAPDLLQVGG
ncbi:MAG TPA: phosphatase PAP2 family protein [Polyangiaceae bacterium]|nr:phosphatase PAP2 family protein [Polyangiaceae bacterium]